MSINGRCQTYVYKSFLIPFCRAIFSLRPCILCQQTEVLLPLDWHQASTEKVLNRGNIVLGYKRIPALLELLMKQPQSWMVAQLITSLYNFQLPEYLVPFFFYFAGTSKSFCPFPPFPSLAYPSWIIVPAKLIQLHLDHEKYLAKILIII